MRAKESADAKAKGPQDESDQTQSDLAFWQVLYQKKKVSKDEAKYAPNGARKNQSCVKCKFNLGDEGRCHIVRGMINNETAISKYFSPKGDGMLPGDIVWIYVKQTGKKLKYEEGHVIEEGATGFQCKNCKYYLYSGDCLLIQGRFKPRMSCGLIVKIGHGTEV